ncbi:hypothetical protein HN512_05165 [Candidatus Peregrinibacteria bacterium]|jgi:hypothetical protein|nr:hypothetical protein [Candidatus Peregrinibacteria bacterium]MBT3599196.1 hypothetical protein [Candidatus Peregrinibacteria bacterium]MBT4367159.1 hypothetical protein [Candidatus Peregrinibacteria bacterium]MBT4585318.1 hypothetical protein [Candidatus Peregrinibacteria bacterium]MBT6731057.1 hypothetical protein [Candidatus Peregrinibacteria bacterium]
MDAGEAAESWRTRLDPVDLESPPSFDDRCVEFITGGQQPENGGNTPPNEIIEEGQSENAAAIKDVVTEKVDLNKVAEELFQLVRNLLSEIKAGGEDFNVLKSTASCVGKLDALLSNCSEIQNKELPIPPVYKRATMMGPEVGILRMMMFLLERLETLKREGKNPEEFVHLVRPFVFKMNQNLSSFADSKARASSTPA